MQVYIAKIGRPRTLEIISIEPVDIIRLQFSASYRRDNNDTVKSPIPSRFRSVTTSKTRFRDNVVVSTPRRLASFDTERRYRRRAWCAPSDRPRAVRAPPIRGPPRRYVNWLGDRGGAPGDA